MSKCEDDCLLRVCKLNAEVQWTKFEGLDDHLVLTRFEQVPLPGTDLKRFCAARETTMFNHFFFYVPAFLSYRVRAEGRRGTMFNLSSW